MRLRYLALVIALLAISTICHAQSAGCSSIQVTAQGVTQAAGSKVARFSISQVVDLELSALFKPGSINRFASGEHVAEFRIYTPTGALYQNVSVPFSSDTTKRGQPQKIAGYPRPVPVEVLADVMTSTGKHSKVSGKLAVAGSPIVLNSMFGEWRVEIVIDGERLTCATPAVFRIDP